jgi:hypothetical protein
MSVESQAAPSTMSDVAEEEGGLVGALWLRWPGHVVQRRPWPWLHRRL